MGMPVLCVVFFGDDGLNSSAECLPDLGRYLQLSHLDFDRTLGTNPLGVDSSSSGAPLALGGREG